MIIRNLAVEEEILYGSPMTTMIYISRISESIDLEIRYICVAFCYLQSTLDEQGPVGEPGDCLLWGAEFRERTFAGISGLLK